MKHVFVADDEKSIRDILCKYIENEGYKVTAFMSGESVLAETERLRPDLLVLDIRMPGMDGIELCREIRRRSDIPIIFVTAKGEELDRVLGLELGADDYLTKPFSPRELVARIKNIFRRMDRAAAASAVPSGSALVLRDLVLLRHRRLLEKNGVEIRLTVKEYEMFNYMAVNRNLPLSREQLLRAVWGYEAIVEDRLVDDLVKRLRKKLTACESDVHITTVWGFGYRLDA